jgi:hypothetical protein
MWHLGVPGKPLFLVPLRRSLCRFGFGFLDRVMKDFLSGFGFRRFCLLAP